MKIVIFSVQIPFIKGGAEYLVDMLYEQLKKRNHEVEIVTIPFKWYNSKTLINCMLMGRLTDLSEINGKKIDLVIAVKFPAYYINHPNKVVWLMHQHRQAYDLWKTKFGDLDKFEGGEFTKNLIYKSDSLYLKEAKSVFTISKKVSERLLKYNNIDSKCLYHLPKNYEKFYFEKYDNYIFYPSRIDSIKRQRLLVESACYIKTNMKIFIAGSGAESEVHFLKEIIRKNKLENKVYLLGFISEFEKIKYYANCKAVYFGAMGEDYGYITLEAMLSQKTVIVHPDAGGPLEFIENNYNGFIIDDNPIEVAKIIDKLYNEKDLAEDFGRNALNSINKKNFDWDYVINELIGE
ncbi:MAG: glycosyltransferase family 4 protein [Candidatus Absconditabacterales bacterium]|nr:glycosyltransferase family 4 protein [Candidatus Absconditabacterales bacterium]